MGIFSVLGVINTIGPCTTDEIETSFAWVEFIERGGKIRRLENLVGGAEISRLIEPDAFGAWYMHETGGSHRILAVERGDGQCAIDYEAIYDCIPYWLAELRASCELAPVN